MSKEKTTNDLEIYRRQIDSIDDEIMTLLKKRIGVVQQVGAFKRSTTPNLCPIRPGREAEMLKRITKNFENSDFSSAAAANIWRIIIGASTTVEAKLVISVFAPDKDSDLFWLAREYFGPAVTIVKQPHIKRVIGDVLDGKASVGVVPTLNSSDTSYWWTNLLQQAADAPKIFAHLPFAYAEPSLKQLPTALAFSRLLPESSGDDVSLYAFEVEHNTSQHRLQSAFAAAKLEVQWLGIASLSPDIRHHLVEIKGFIPPEHADIKSFQAALGSAIMRTHFLGAYAVPFSLSPNESITVSHEKNPANA